LIWRWKKARLTGRDVLVLEKQLLFINQGGETLRVGRVLVSEKNGQGRPEASRCFRNAPEGLMAVSRILSDEWLAPQVWTVICLTPRLSAGEVLADCDQYPKGFAARAACWAGGPIPSVLSCTAWGFSCPLAYARGGGLLPRLFTLAARLAPGWAVFFL